MTMKLIDFNKLYYEIQFTIGYCMGVVTERHKGQADSIIIFKDLGLMDLLSIGGNDGIGIYQSNSDGELISISTSQVEEILQDIHIDNEGEHFNTMLKKMAIFNAYQGAYNLLDILCYQFDELDQDSFILIIQIYIERIIHLLNEKYGIELDMSSINSTLDDIFTYKEEDEFEIK